MADEVDFNAYCMELRMNLARLESIVNESEKLVAEGNFDSAAMVLGSQDGKIGRFKHAYDELYEAVGGREAAERAIGNRPE